MRKVYKVTGFSATHPGDLPNGFSVSEKEVGEVHQIMFEGSGRHTNFVETKQGDVVVYREGITNSNFKIPHDELPALVRFLNQVWLEHRGPSNCPGTPHMGHSASDWSCPLDRT